MPVLFHHIHVYLHTYTYITHAHTQIRVHARYIPGSSTVALLWQVVSNRATKSTKQHVKMYECAGCMCVYMFVSIYDETACVHALNVWACVYKSV
jgi:hypothetical protein